MRWKKSLSVAQGGDEEPLINLTPLIDVVFVVLIIFILIAPMLEVDHVQLASASPSTQQASHTSPITIHVRSDNSIWIQKQHVPSALLLPTLQQMRQRHPHAPVQLFHDKQAHFGTYQSIKTAVEQAGFEELDIMLEPSAS